MNKKKSQDPSQMQDLRDSLSGPPDAPISAGYTVLADCVIIVADKSTAIQILGRTPTRRTPPS